MATPKVAAPPAPQIPPPAAENPVPVNPVPDVTPQEVGGLRNPNAAEGGGGLQVAEAVERPANTPLPPTTPPGNPAWTPGGGRNGNIDRGNAAWKIAAREGQGPTQPQIQGPLIPVVNLNRDQRTGDDFEYQPRLPHNDADVDDRFWQQRLNGNNRNDLRRGMVREYLQENLRNAVLQNAAQFNDRSGLQQFSRGVAETLSRTLNDTAILTDKTVNMVMKEVVHLLGKDFKGDFARPSVIPIDQATQIANLLVRNIGNKMDPILRDNPQKVIDGLLLLQLCANPGRYIDDMRSITGHKPCILPEGVPWSAFRNIGVLAAVLMKEGAAAKTPAELDAAVQRFVKILIAGNQLGILLAAIKLTADARSGAMSASRVMALVQIYELIAQLMVKAEKAMVEAAVNTKPAELTKTDRGLAFSEAKSVGEAETALRNYIDFNPAARADTSASAFFSEDIAENASRIAVDSSRGAMEEWLNSGRHRFVNDVDLGKPLGIVIDKASDECFTASAIRIVLVRDTSVLGWRMFRSFLV